METTVYTAADVQQILALAMGPADVSSEAQLQEMAAELSIDDVALQHAIKTWRVQQRLHRAKQLRRSHFYRQRLLPYVAVNLLLIGINVATVGTVTWAIYPLLGWGGGLLLNLEGTDCCRSLARPTLATPDTASLHFSEDVR